MANMTDVQQREAAQRFVKRWRGKGYEKGESQSFWLSLLRDVFGVEQPEDLIKFEEQVHLDHTSFIDGIIPLTRVLIEQKGLGKDLNKPIRQSDGTLLTPFKQAKRYITELPVSQHPRWVVICNFAEFDVYDMENPAGEPERILLEDLEKEYYRLKFLVNVEDHHIEHEMEVSIAAGDIVGLLYDALQKQYADPNSSHALKSLNVLCVRLVFCLYAEDAGIFGSHGMFHDYLSEFDARHTRRALVDLFKILDTKPEDRDPYLADDNPDLVVFPYVNGGLFADEDIEIPPFTDEIRELLLEKASANFNWSEISPTIFGAVFESTLNPETRRAGGMHYTSIENIHKVIDPLFLDEINAEFEKIKAINAYRINGTKNPVTRNIKIEKLNKLQEKLASLKFLDPACGSGNFLTETYLSLRRIENEIIRIRHDLEEGVFLGQIMFGDSVDSPIRISISQFYGIEINDFAVTVAKTALWIAESQMLKETEEIVHSSLDFLPLKTNAYIVEGNALRIDWEKVVPKTELRYIIGNPPFVGYKMQSEKQKNDLRPMFGTTKNIDYVAGWYYKAAEYMSSSGVRSAFVSTNSITQGEQVTSVWKTMFELFGVHIDFAYQTFIWDSEASLKAHVHCVIVGFSVRSNNHRILFEKDKARSVDNINAYLVDGPNIFISRRQKALCNCQEMLTGSEPRDGGFLLIDAAEREEVLKKYPELQNYIKRFITGEDFINNKLRYCLWLKNAAPGIINRNPFIMQRLDGCKKFREGSKQAQAHKMAEYPSLFVSERQPDSDYLLIPQASSESRKYIPIGYISKDIIVSNTCFIVSNATKYAFGILTSNVHMAWVRTVCGRLKSDYRYSNTIVYNNFPWPKPTGIQEKKIEETAQAILDARKIYSNENYAVLYNQLSMPPELRKAHQQNDKAVMQAYGFDSDMSEPEIVAALMQMYQDLTSK